MLNWVSFCAHTVSDFDVTVLPTHHPEEQAHKAMLSRWRWESAPTGTLGAHLGVPGNTV